MINKEITLSSWGENHVSVNAIQGENLSRTVTVTLLGSAGQPIDLTGGVPRIYVANNVFHDGTVVDAKNGIAQFVITSGMLTTPGNIKCQLLVSGPNYPPLKFDGPILKVIPSNLENAVEGSDDFSALVVALNSVSASVIAVETAVTKANTAITNCDTATASANAAATAANNAASGADASKATADLAADKANSAAAAAGNAAQAANTAKNYAATATAAANNAAQSANTAAAAANDKAALADTAASNANAKASAANTVTDSANAAALSANDAASAASTAKDNAVVATNNANTAAANANTAKDAAVTATTAANTAANRANTAAANAEDVLAGKLDPAIDARLAAKTDVTGGIASFANASTHYNNQVLHTTAEEKQKIATAVPNSRKINGHALTGDVTVTKADVGLGSVDNTPDANKSVNYAASAGSAPANGGNANTVGGWSFEAAGADPTATLPPGRVHFTY